MRKKLMISPLLVVVVFFVFLLLTSNGAAAAAVVVEPKSGVNFPDRYKGKTLESLGLRTKGPIKVYSVGKYGSTFYLQMLMKVGGEKMSSSLSAALQPRGCSTDVTEEFESLLLSGLPKKGGISKGTSLAFDTGKGKLSVFVNDKHVGTISNQKLAQAFAGIYTDSKAVCQLLPPPSSPPLGGANTSVDATTTTTTTTTSPTTFARKNCVKVLTSVAIGIGIGLSF